MSEQNGVLVDRAIAEVWNKGNYAILNELVASDVVIHSSTPGEEIHGREAFPDIHFTIEDQIAQGDRVVTRWSARATHKGEFQGIPPTDKQVNLSGIDIDRLVNGKVVECWPIVDELNLLQQLGVLPARNQVEPH
jgi:predicted ester cyclase